MDLYHFGDSIQKVVHHGVGCRRTGRQMAADRGLEQLQHSLRPAMGRRRPSGKQAAQLRHMMEGLTGFATPEPK